MWISRTPSKRILLLLAGLISLAGILFGSPDTQIANASHTLSPGNHLVYKDYGVDDVYLDILPPPCDPSDPDAACNSDSMPYYKPADYLSSRTPRVERDSHRWPSSPSVKLRSHWPSGEVSDCSGMLIDAKFVLSAAGCVFSHTPERCLPEDSSCWVADVEVIPAYDQGTFPYGKSGYQTILSWTAFTDDQDPAYNLAVIELRYPIGAGSGWLGVGFNTDDVFFTTQSFNRSAYPHTAPHNGETLSLWEGDLVIDENSSERLYHPEGEDPGCLGAAYYPGDYIAYGILSHYDAHQGAGVLRLDYPKFSAIRTFIEEGKPKDEGDLAVFNVQVEPRWNLPGQRLTRLDFTVYNHSTQSMAMSDYSAAIYLSEDNLITPADTLLGSLHFTAAFPAGTGLRLSAPSEFVQLPSEIYGNQINGGIFYVGILLTPDDNFPVNNRTDLFQPAPIWINNSDNIHYFFPFWGF